MGIFTKKEPLVLFLGDIFLFYVALWLALFVRYLEVPSQGLLLSHVEPFSVIFFVWIVTFFIAGLYEKHTLLLQSRLPAIIFRTQIINSILAALFFYVAPAVGIA